MGDGLDSDDTDDSVGVGAAEEVGVDAAYDEYDCSKPAGAWEEAEEAAEGDAKGALGTGAFAPSGTLLTNMGSCCWGRGAEAPYDCSSGVFREADDDGRDSGAEVGIELIPVADGAAVSTPPTAVAGAVEAVLVTGVGEAGVDEKAGVEGAELMEDDVAVVGVNVVAVEGVGVGAVVILIGAMSGGRLAAGCDSALPTAAGGALGFAPAAAAAAEVDVGRGGFAAAADGAVAEAEAGAMDVMDAAGVTLPAVPTRRCSSALPFMTMLAMLSIGFTALSTVTGAGATSGVGLFFGAPPGPTAAPATVPTVSAGLAAPAVGVMRVIGVMRAGLVAARAAPGLLAAEEAGDGMVVVLVGVTTLPPVLMTPVVLALTLTVTGGRATAAAAG